MSRRDHLKSEQSLISTSTILIISGFLIGLTVGKIVAEDLSPYVLSCGLSGFLAFIALDLARVKREESEALEEQLIMEERLDKHVNSLSSIGFTLPPLVEVFNEDVAEEKELAETSAQ